MKLHFRLKQMLQSVICILVQFVQVAEAWWAIRAMGQVLKMVEDERLESGDPHHRKSALLQ